MLVCPHRVGSARFSGGVRSLAAAGTVAWSLWSGAAYGQAAADLEPGAAVEVREGDVWSSAELVKREGRRFQIRYADGTEEWVTQERLRVGGAEAEGAGGGGFRGGGFRGGGFRGGC